MTSDMQWPKFGSNATGGEKHLQNLGHKRQSKSGGLQRSPAEAIREIPAYIHALTNKGRHA